MSVEVQTSHGHKQFGINSSQFEEIVPSDEHLSSKRKEMKKGSDIEAPTDKTTKKSESKSNYSSDGNGSYEDDFEESETPKPSLRNVTQKSKSVSGKSSPRRRGLSHSSRSPETSTAKSTGVLSRRSNRKFKKKFKAFESPRSSSPASSHVPEKSWGRPKNRSANVKLSRLDESVVDRVLSANRHKVQKLESRLSHLVKELTSERDENKTLRQIHYRQEKELIKVNSEEAELPRLLTKHMMEVNSLRERMRRLQETTVQKENKLNDQDKEILKLRDRCKHYKDLCEMKNLTERADLQKKLTQTQENLEKRDSEISKLQRNLNLKDKAHGRHLKDQKDKLHETEARLKLMEENYNNLQDRLKEKEKQLDYTNIYQRQIVLKEKGKSLPESPPKMAALPAPNKTMKPKTKKTNNITKNNNKNNGNIKDKTEDKKEVEVNKKPDSFFLTAHSDTGSDKEIDKNAGKKPEKDKQLSITDGDNVGMSSFNKHKTMEEELAESNDRLRREEFERSLHEEDERLKKEKEEWERKKKEEEQREERERAERETKWREDSAKKAREEQERIQESAKHRREEEEKKKAEEAKQKEDSFFEDEESTRKKEQLLARLKAIDGENRTNEDAYHSDSKKLPQEKSGNDKIEKNGLPPLGTSVVSPPVSVKSDPDGVFGIPRNKPMLVGRGKLVKKSTPFSWLDDNNNSNKRPGGNNAKRNDDFGFGNYSPSVSKKKSGDLDGFDTGYSHKPGRGRRGGDLGENGFHYGEQSGSGDKPKMQNNLPFLSEDFGNKKKGDTRSLSPSNNEPLLPRRRRAQEKSGPVISSVFDDNLDDDIEELTL